MVMGTKEKLAYYKARREAIKNGTWHPQKVEKILVPVTMRIDPDIWHRLAMAIPAAKSRYTKGSRSEFISQAIDEKLKRIGR